MEIDSISNRARALVERTRGTPEFASLGAVESARSPVTESAQPVREYPPSSGVTAPAEGKAKSDAVFSDTVGKIGKTLHAVTEQLLVMHSGADGTLQFFDKDSGGLGTKRMEPRKTVLVQRIRSIRWCGLEVSTPMEDFKLRMPKLIYDDESVAGAVTDLFRNMHDYWHKKRSEARDQKPRRDTEFNAMAVGELLAGRVLYQPKSIMNPEGAELDALRLSVGLGLVKKQLMKNNIRYSGLLNRSSNSTTGQMAKTMTEWEVQASDGVLTFIKPGTGQPLAMLDMDSITRLRIDEITLMTDYGEISLANCTSSPAVLDKLVPLLEQHWFSVRDAMPPTREVEMPPRVDGISI